MPQQKWEVTLSNGDVVTVMSDKEPTPAEVMKAMRRSDDPKPPAQPASPTSTAPAPPEKALLPEQVMNRAVYDLGVGALKGAGDTAMSLGRLVHKIPGVSNTVDRLWGGNEAGGTSLSEEAFRRGGTIDKDLETSNATQAVGKGLERVGEFAVPSGMAAKAAPLVRGSLQPLRLGTRMVLEAGGAAPVAALHGENPTVAAVTAAAMPLAGKVLEPTGRWFVERAIKPTKAHLREMTGAARDTASKIGRVVDTAIDHRIMREGGAAREIGTRMDEIDDIFAGPAGDQPSNLQSRIPQAIDDFRLRYQGGVNSAGASEPGVMFGRAGAASADSAMPEILEGVLGKPNPPAVNMPAGMSQPARVLRDDVNAREAYAVAKQQNLENAKIPFGEHLGPGPEMKKTGEMTLRNAAKDAADMPQPGVSATGAVIPANRLKPLFGEVSDLVDVRKAVQNAPPDMPRTAAGEMLSGVNIKLNLAIRLARAMGLPAGQIAHMAGEGLQGREGTHLLDTLMRAFLTSGASGVTEDR